MTLNQITKIRGPGIHTTSNIVSHNINSSGIITAVAFKGPFTGSSNIQSGILTATKIDLNGDIDVDGHTNLDNVNVAGVATFASAVNTGALTATTGTFSGNVSIGGTLTYEDVTNIDSVGIITARDGLKVLAGGANVVGVVTATTFKGNGDFVELDVDGHTNLDNVSISGFTTITQDLDVDGHTNLDNVSIAGVTTITGGRIDVDNTGNPFIGTRFNAGADGAVLFLQHSRSNTIGTKVKLNDNDQIGAVQFRAYRSDNSTITNAASIQAEVNGTPSANGVPADLIFNTGTTSAVATARLRIKSTGQVTIGAIAATDTASGILHTKVSNTTSPVVFENDTENADVVIRTTGTNKHSILGFGDGGNNFAGNIDYDHQNNAMVFDTNGGERLNISSAGIVTQVETGTGNGQGGIKASTASAGGNAGFGFITGGTQRFSIVTIGSAGSEALRVYDVNNSAERFRIKSDGHVRVGSGDPNYELELVGAGSQHILIGSTDASAATLILDGDSNGDGSGSDYATIMHSTAGNLEYHNRKTADHIFKIGTSNEEKLRIDSNGHVKISNNSGKIRMGSSNQLELYHNGTYGYLNDTTSSGTELRIAGRVVRVMDNDSSHTIAYFSDDAAKLYSANSEKLATTSTGITVGGEVATAQDYPNQRPTLDLNFAAVKKLDSRITYYRTGPASYVDEYGLVQCVGANTPRFDHDPVTKESKGLLIEASRSNLFAGTSNMSASGGVWQTGGPRGAQGANVKGPDGKMTAYQNVYNGTGGDLNIFYSPRNGATEMTTTNDTTYTMSVWAKLSAGASYITGCRLRTYNQNISVNYDLANGLVLGDGVNPANAYENAGSDHISSSIEEYPDGWYRCIMTFRSDASGSQGFQFYVLSGGNNGTLNSSGANGEAMYYWGAQLEVGSYATSFIPTDLGNDPNAWGPTTRGSDFAFIDGTTGTDFDDIYRLDEGTFVVDWFNNPKGNHNDGYVLAVDDGSGNNRIAAVNSNNYQVTVTAGGSSQGTRDLGSINSGDNKIAFTYKLNDQATSLNGSDASVDTSCTLPTGLKYIWFGLRQGQYDLLGGYISRIIYYPKRLPNNQLKNLSS